MKMSLWYNNLKTPI